jgi:hypothetical protein
MRAWRAKCRFRRGCTHTCGTSRDVRRSHIQRRGSTHLLAVGTSWNLRSEDLCSSARRSDHRFQQLACMDRGSLVWPQGKPTVRQAGGRSGAGLACNKCSHGFPRLWLMCISLSALGPRLRRAYTPKGPPERAEVRVCWRKKGGDGRGRQTERRSSHPERRTPSGFATKAPGTSAQPTKISSCCTGPTTSTRPSPGVMNTLSSLRTAIRPAR